MFRALVAAHFCTLPYSWSFVFNRTIDIGSASLTAGRAVRIAQYPVFGCGIWLRSDQASE